jgi:hypothetical protein
MAELYPAGQAFSANLEALVLRNGVWRDHAKTIADASKEDLDRALHAVDEKLAGLAKAVQDRSNARIDMDTFNKEIAAYEKDPKAAAKLEASRAKLAAATEVFNGLESTLAPALAVLDKELAAITAETFQRFIQAQVAYNGAVVDAYNAGLGAIPLAAGEAAPAAAEAAPEAAAGGSSGAPEGGDAPAAEAPAAEAPAAEAPAAEAPAAADAPVEAAAPPAEAS